MKSGGLSAWKIPCALLLSFLFLSTGETAVAGSNSSSRHVVYSNGDLKSVRQTVSALYHTVKQGDTLYSIARKYSVTIGELKRLNRLRTSRLGRGRKLLIRPANPGTYTVRKGDTLWKIAKRFNVDPDDLMEINKMDTPVIRVGQKLYLHEIVDNCTGRAYAGSVDNHTRKHTAAVSGPEEAAGESASDRLVAFARKLLDIPYKLGGNSILRIDCSAYVRKVYGLLRIYLPITAREQFNSGEPVSNDKLSVGDPLFFGTHSFPSHVGIYLGTTFSYMPH